MISIFVSWFMKNGKATIVTGAASATAIVVLILALNVDTNARIIKSESNQKVYMREYVALSLKPIETSNKHIQAQQKEIKSMIKDIHKHLFKN